MSLCVTLGEFHFKNSLYLIIYLTFDAQKLTKNIWSTAKGGFFSESAMQISKKNIPKNYLELEI